MVQKMNLVLVKHMTGCVDVMGSHLLMGMRYLLIICIQCFILQLRSLYAEHTADVADQLSVGETYDRVCRRDSEPVAYGQPSADGNDISTYETFIAHLVNIASETGHRPYHMVGMHACTECRDCTLPPFFIFFRSGSLVQIYASVSNCKNPGSHCVKLFSSLRSHP